MAMTAFTEKLTLLLAAGVVAAGLMAMRNHRADIAIAQAARDCAADRELADLIARTFPVPMS